MGNVITTENCYFVKKEIAMPNVKKELHQMIDQTEDDKVLDAVYALLSNQKVAMTTDGIKLNQTAFEAKIDEGEVDITSGSTLSHEDVKAHFKKKHNG
jgi:predicted transcriptional regulator